MNNSQYCVIDLSAGAAAKSYPVSYMDTMPKDGWGDEFKTMKLVLRLIPAGTFMMGKKGCGENRRYRNEEHKVTLTKSYYIGVFPVTQKQWELVMGTREDFTVFGEAADADLRPIDIIKYTDIRGKKGVDWPAVRDVGPKSFIGLLRKRTKLGALDLPTEAQWECACRAGSLDDFGALAGDKKGNPQDMGWYQENSNKETHPVGLKKCNGLGLYDMHGNVDEWCLDFDCDGGLTADDAVDPEGPRNPSSNEYRRVVRGGCYETWMEYAGCANRSSTQARKDSSYSFGHGLRLAMTVV